MDIFSVFFSELRVGHFKRRKINLVEILLRVKISDWRHSIIGIDGIKRSVVIAVVWVRHGLLVNRFEVRGRKRSIGRSNKILKRNILKSRKRRKKILVVVVIIDINVIILRNEMRVGLVVEKRRRIRRKKWIRFRRRDVGVNNTHQFVDEVFFVFRLIIYNDGVVIIMINIGVGINKIIFVLLKVLLKRRS